MTTRIKVISGGADYEVYHGRNLIGTCGALPAANRLYKLVLGAEAALKYLRLCDDKVSATAEVGAEAINQLEFGLNKGRRKRS